VAALGLLIGVFDLVAEQPRLTDCIQKFLGGEAQATPQLREEASPLYQLHADLPPTLMVQVSEDPVCPHIEAKKMRDRLAKLQVIHRLHTIKGNQHELSPQDAHPPVRDWMREHL